MNIDATNLIVGRMASVVAKKALLGEKINIMNCEKAVITGNKKDIIGRYRRYRSRGTPSTGPYQPRMSDRIVRRIIKRMLPHKKERGKKAYKNIMCYISIPEKMKNEKLDTIPLADVKKVKSLKYVSIGTIARSLGGKA